MSENITDYRCKLLNKILFAESQNDVQILIDAAIEGLKQHKVDNYIFDRFLDKTIQNLEEFNPGDYNAQQWANIHMSKIVFNRIRISITKMVY